jgi:hypothetical protein
MSDFFARKSNEKAINICAGQTIVYKNGRCEAKKNQMTLRCEMLLNESIKQIC